MTGLLILIGSGETSERMLNLYRSLLARRPPPGSAEAEPARLAFIDTPAGFQLNAGALGESVAAYFQRHLALDVDLVEYRSASGATPEGTARAVAQLGRANVILAGAGSPTYAIRQWRGGPVYQALVERFNAGAQVVFASAAVIALSRFALPVYEIYKAGADPYWAQGLDLLGPFGLDLALLPHFDNREGRTYDTRYCFMGRPRLLELEKLLPPSTVILGIDEKTACTIDIAAAEVRVYGAGRVTVRHQGQERHYPAGAAFDLDRLTPARALAAPDRPRAAAEPPPAPARPSAARKPQPAHVPDRVREWAAERDRLRRQKNYAESDRLRERIASVGYAVKDSPSGPILARTRYRSSRAVPTQLDSPASLDWSVSLLAGPGGGSRREVLRAAKSALEWGAGQSLEVVIVDNDSQDGAAEAVADLAAEDPQGRVRPIFLAADLGEAAGRNAGLRASRGQNAIILGGHMEIAGDVFTPLAATLADSSIGATGSNGLLSGDLFTFSPAPTGEGGAGHAVEVDAIEFYLFAFRRDRLQEVGLLDEKFVFYRNLDLDWSMAFKAKGLRLVVTPGLPLAAHEHPFLRMDPAERERLSKKNYRRFLSKWRDRTDLLLNPTRQA